MRRFLNWYSTTATATTTRTATTAAYTVKDIIAIEQKWKSRWANASLNKMYRQVESTGKSFILSMMPYPSGTLHMGHVRVYTISDTLSRFERLKGKRVLHPMSWDAFGLPAENAAIERGIQPDIWTKSNIEQMKQQLNSLSLNLDWQNEINTCEPDYYKWTQLIFLRLFKRGLAYRKDSIVNWDPIDMTVLADEQVDEKGKSWRSGALVEKKSLTQWFLKITEYKNELLNGLKALNWPESVKDMQNHWIIKEQLFVFDLPIFDTARTKRIVVGRLEDWCYAKEVVSADGLDIGCKIKNPVTGELLDIIEGACKNSIGSEIIKGKKKLMPIVSPESIPHSHKILEYRLRDWLISRQRYWGTPIPIIHCGTCGTVPVPEDQLPVVLPKIASFTGKDGSALEKLSSWHKVNCPKCGNEAKRETDTMDTFMDSSWYYIRNCDPKNQSEIINIEAIKQWMPVDCYIGGIEHAILHLLYARFINKFIMEEIGIKEVEPDHAKYMEPFRGLITQGLVEGMTCQCPDTKKYLRPEELDLNFDGQTIVKDTGKQPLTSWDKMSKSKYNGVDPTDLVDKYGADTLRLCILFKAPPEVSLRWNTRDISGPQRWVVRLLNMTRQAVNLGDSSDGKDIGEDEKLVKFVQKTITNMEYAYSTEHHRLNLAVSNLMKLSNQIEDSMKNATPKVLRSAIHDLAICLNPIAPHTSSEILEILGVKVENLSWPRKDSTSTETLQASNENEAKFKDRGINSDEVAPQHN